MGWRERVREVKSRERQGVREKKRVGERQRDGEGQ